MSLLTIAECAVRLRMSSSFIRSEISKGRLIASRHQRESGRRRYRIREEDFDTYRATYWLDNHVPQESSQRA